MKNINFNEYRDRAYQIACEKGFHDEQYSVEHYKCLIISELMEAVEADRNNRRSSKTLLELYESYPSGKAFEILFKDTLEDELADACIRIFDLARAFEIDMNGGGMPQGISKSFTESIYYICEYLITEKNLTSCLKETLLTISHLAYSLNIDLIKHIDLKMQYNQTRTKKHGKLY